MGKIVIIGSSGAAKSTFARYLGSILKFNVVHLDRVFWGPGWKEKPRDARIEILQELVRERQWIIEGTYLGSSDPRLNAADTIIFLDIKSSICLRRIVKRHRPFWRLRGLILKQKREYQDLRRRDLPKGCVDKLTLLCIVKVIFFPVLGRRKLIKKLEVYTTQHIIPKEIIWLHSTEEVEDFLAQLEAQTNEKNNSTGISTSPRNRHLALARR